MVIVVPTKATIAALVALFALLLGKAPNQRVKKPGTAAYHILPRPPRASGGLLRLRLHERRQQLLSFLISESQIGVGVQSEYLRPIDPRERLDESNVVLYLVMV